MKSDQVLIKTKNRFEKIRAQLFHMRTNNVNFQHLTNNESIYVHTLHLMHVNNRYVSSNVLFLCNFSCNLHKFSYEN
jgi:hypothetical protein